MMTTVFNLFPPIPDFRSRYWVSLQARLVELDGTVRKKISRNSSITFSLLFNYFVWKRSGYKSSLQSRTQFLFLVKISIKPSVWNMPQFIKVVHAPLNLNSDYERKLVQRKRSDVKLTDKSFTKSRFLTRIRFQGHSDPLPLFFVM